MRMINSLPSCSIPLTKKTKTPIIINTSLNIRGRPIARTPEDAIGTFYTSAIDYVLFNERILVRKANCE